jgi:hypothetical protein
MQSTKASVTLDASWAEQDPGGLLANGEIPSQSPSVDFPDIAIDGIKYSWPLTDVSSES